jgi:hypothetical protein
MLTKCIGVSEKNDFKNDLEKIKLTLNKINDTIHSEKGLYVTIYENISIINF